MKNESELSPPSNPSHSSSPRMFYGKFNHLTPSEPSSSSSHQPSLPSTIENVIASRPFVGKPIKPRGTRDIKLSPSSLRPAVAARDRISHWVTPYSLSQLDSMLGEISFDSIRKINVAVISSLAESTRTGYGAGLLRFTEFCDREGVSEYSRMPASAVLLAAFVADQASKASSSSINSWMSAVRAWHVINNAPWYGSSEFVCQVKLGSSRMAPVSSKKIPRNPVTLEHSAHAPEGSRSVGLLRRRRLGLSPVSPFLGVAAGSVSSPSHLKSRSLLDMMPTGSVILSLYSLPLMLTFHPYTQIYCRRDVRDLSPHLILLSLLAAGFGLLPHPVDEGLEGRRS
ncbi:hypothetical protein H1R20_g8990, partial [Candolleomyces eurysporus]